MKVVRGSLNSEPFQSMSTSRELLCAASQGPNIVVATVDSKINEILTFAPLSSSGNYAITDIAWSCTNFGQLAVSSTNGNLSVFDMESSILQKSVSNPKSIWNGTVTTRSVHKICWHEDELSTLATANQDGIVRIFDTRLAGQTNNSGTIICQEFNPKCDAIRDVHFNPFNAFQFAAISENGTLTVWDRRQTDSSIMKILAHTSSGLSISYHPHKEGIIATGGKDKYLKIWDVSSNNETDDSNKLNITTNNSMNSSNSNINNSTSNNNNNISSSSNTLHTSNPIKPIFSVRTPGQVNSLQWRGKHHAILDTSAQQHSLLESQIATASIERNEVLVWNLNYPYIPACVLSGHGDVCTDFRWIDTPKDSTAAAVQNFQDADANGLDVNQHILSIGKDGKMMIQDLRNAYFPRQHIFTNIVALSSTGDVAFHRGNVSKLDLLGLVTNEATSNSTVLFKDEPHHFGMDFSLKSPNKNIYYINSALSLTQQSNLNSRLNSSGSNSNSSSSSSSDITSSNSINNSGSSNNNINSSNSINNSNNSGTSISTSNSSGNSTSISTSNSSGSSTRGSLTSSKSSIATSTDTATTQYTTTNNSNSNHSNSHSNSNNSNNNGNTNGSNNNNNSNNTTNTNNTSNSSNSMSKSQKSSKLTLLSSSPECMNNIKNMTTIMTTLPSSSPSSSSSGDYISSSPLTPSRKFLRQNGVISLATSSTIRRSRDQIVNDTHLHNNSSSSSGSSSSNNNNNNHDPSSTMSTNTSASTTHTAAAVVAARERKQSEEDVLLSNANAMFRSFFSGYSALDARDTNDDSHHHHHQNSSASSSSSSSSASSNSSSSSSSSRNASSNHSRSNSSLSPSISHNDILITDITATRAAPSAAAADDDSTSNNTTNHHHHHHHHENSQKEQSSSLPPLSQPSARVLTLIKNSTCQSNGIVFIGRTNIDNLITAKSIRHLKNGAEGRKFDPAVIKLLAAEYTLGGGSQGNQNGSPEASCKHNVQVAENAGFQCRAALFRTILTLFPVVEVSASTAVLSSISGAKHDTSIVNSSNTNTNNTNTNSNNIVNATQMNNNTMHDGILPTTTTTKTATNTAPAATTTTTTNNNNNNATTASTDRGSLPFAAELIGEVLSDLLEVGDCQHFVIVCEILLRMNQSFLNQCLMQANITPTRRLEAYYTYIELLRRFKQFSKANEIIMQTDIANNTVLNQYGVLMYISCSQCGKELPDRISMPWCQKCHKHIGNCVICNEPVRGLFRWCAVCGHGGHSECTKKWFHNCNFSTCPSGCGHDCNALNHFD